MSASTMTSLEDVTLAVVTSGEAIVACASLRPVSGKTVTSSLSWARVRGSFEFSQQSPFDVTKTSIEVTGLEVSSYSEFGFDSNQFARVTSESSRGIPRPQVSGPATTA